MKAEKKAEPPAPKAGVGTPEPGCANHRHGPMGAPITEEPKQAKAKAKVKAKAKAKDAPDRTPGAFCGPGPGGCASVRFAAGCASEIPGGRTVLECGVESWRTWEKASFRGALRLFAIRI